MAEATDRPQSPGQVPAEAVMSGEEPGAVAPQSSETYRPLSLLALASFALAVVYCLIVLVGGAISLFGHVPWLLPGWTFLIPIAALILCWAARTRINNSEGTLSGLAFTTWGSRLAILVGLTYAAYYGFTFFAVRLQAVNCADGFFEKIKQGQIEQAFLMSQSSPPPKETDKNQLREMLESRFNQPTTPGSPGAFSRFSQERFVRFIEMDGEKAKITPRGVAEWEYGKGGYRVVLNYHVATSLMDFDMRVETFGRDPKPDEPKGLKWQVLLTRGETSLVEPLTPTPEGEEFVKKIIKAHQFASDWVGKVNDPEALTPVQREELSKLIRLDEKTFWAAEKHRADIIKRVNNTFQPSVLGKPNVSLSLPQIAGALPRLREGDGRTTVLLDLTLRYLDENGMQPQYMVNGQLVVSAESSAAAGSTSAWRVDALNIESGRTPPSMEQRRPPDPRTSGPGGPRPR